MFREEKIQALKDAMLSCLTYYQDVLLKNKLIFTKEDHSDLALDVIAEQAAYCHGILLSHELIKDDVFIDLAWEYQDFLRNEAA